MLHVTVTTPRANGSRKAYGSRTDAERSAGAHRTSWTVAAANAWITTEMLPAPGQGCLTVRAQRHQVTGPRVEFRCEISPRGSYRSSTRARRNPPGGWTLRSPASAMVGPGADPKEPSYVHCPPNGAAGLGQPVRQDAAPAALAGDDHLADRHRFPVPARQQPVPRDQQHRRGQPARLGTLDACHCAGAPASLPAGPGPD